ncbi:MAG: FecR domain-containing protein, partial [Verrucomicrobiota bacterium]
MEDRLLQLLLQARDEGDESARKELNHLLRSDPEARRMMARFLTEEQALIGHLREETIVSLLDPTDSDRAEALSRKGGLASPAIIAVPRSRLILGGMIVAALILTLTRLPGLLAPRDPERGVARIIRLEGSASSHGSRQLASRAELFAGEKLTMNEGLIELAFRESGVHVIATAPLAIELESTEHMFLHRGEMKLVVPPQGVGFVVDTPERTITDLGTSFVVKSSQEGSKVLVLDGQIAVDAPTGGPQHLMSEGQVAKFGPNGAFRVRQRSGGHPDIPELSSLLFRDPSAGSLPGLLLGFQEPPPFLPANPVG